MHRAFIVRHGNTFAPGEPPRRIGARTDLPLVASGIAQAEALRDHFHREGVTFDRVLTSPLLRTRQTAAIIAPGVPAEPVDWLREIDHGPDEDKTEPEVLARIGADALAAWEERAEVPPGWVVDADARMAAWRRFLDEPGADVTLCVTSNGAARFVRLASGLAPAKLRTGAYAIVETRLDKIVDQVVPLEAPPLQERQVNRAPRGSGQAGSLNDLTLGWGGDYPQAGVSVRPTPPTPSPEGKGRAKVTTFPSLATSILAWDIRPG